MPLTEPTRQASAVSVKEKYWQVSAGPPTLELGLWAGMAPGRWTAAMTKAQAAVGNSRTGRWILGSQDASGNVTLFGGGTLYARFTKKETPGDWQALELKGG